MRLALSIHQFVSNYVKITRFNGADRTETSTPVTARFAKAIAFTTKPATMKI